MKRKYLIIFTSLVFCLSVVLLVFIPKIKMLSKIKGTSTENLPVREISGIIVPHHDLAKEFIIGSFEKLSQNQKYSYIVVIGPNHSDPTSQFFVSSLSLKNYSIAADKILQIQGDSPDLMLNTTLTESEHSVGTPIKYVPNYFSGSNIIPLIVPSVFSDEKLNKMADILVQSFPADTLYVAGVDFSHNNLLAEAREFDQESINAIENFNYEQIYKFSNNNLDSPSAIGLLLKIMERLNKKNWELYYNSQGALLEDNPSVPSTSYVIGVFGK